MSIWDYYCEQCDAVIAEDDIITTCTDRGDRWQPPCYEVSCPHCGSDGVTRIDDMTEEEASAIPAVVAHLGDYPLQPRRTK